MQFRNASADSIDKTYVGFLTCHIYSHPSQTSVDGMQAMTQFHSSQTSVDGMQAMTQFHYILLYPDSLRMTNRVSQKVVQTLSLAATPGSTQGLATDTSSSTVYLYKGQRLAGHHPTVLLA